MTMADEKRYFSVKDMFEQAVTRAKTDPRYEEYSKICELDYDLLCSTCKYDKLYRCEFDVVGEVTYGSSEGIYGDIFLMAELVQRAGYDPVKRAPRLCAQDLEAGQGVVLGSGNAGQPHFATTQMNS